MRKSTNYGLKLMEGTDNVKRQDFVDNFEKIDTELKNNDTQLKEIANKVDNIKIADGTTDQKGIVKLNNTVTSTSISEAATANAVKTAYDKGNEALNKANQAFQYANNGKTTIANVIGNINGNNTHAEIANRIQIDKNTAANNLNSKGISANGNEALASLVAKIANINVEHFITGTFNYKGNTPITISVGFNPKIIIVYRFVNSRTYFALNVPSLNIGTSGETVYPVSNGFKYDSGGNADMNDCKYVCM